MPDDAAVFVDTNVLVYASVPSSPWHTVAIEALKRFDSTGAEVWISNQVIREYLVCMTRDDLRGSRSLAEVVQQAAKLAEHYRIAEETALIQQTLLSLIREHGVQGKPIHDANIAATCLAYRIPRLLTHNTRDFTRYAKRLEIVPLADV